MEQHQNIGLTNTEPIVNTNSKEAKMKILLLTSLLLISISTLAEEKIIRCDSCETRSDFEDAAFQELKKEYSLYGTSYLFSYQGYNIDELFYIYSRKSQNLFALDPACGPSMRGPNFSDCYFINNTRKINSEIGETISTRFQVITAIHLRGEQIISPPHK